MKNMQNNRNWKGRPSLMMWLAEATHFSDDYHVQPQGSCCTASGVLLYSLRGPVVQPQEPCCTAKSSSLLGLLFSPWRSRCVLKIFWYLSGVPGFS